MITCGGGGGRQFSICDHPFLIHTHTTHAYGFFVANCEMLINGLENCGSIAFCYSAPEPRVHFLISYLNLMCTNALHDM